MTSADELGIKTMTPIRYLRKRHRKSVLGKIRRKLRRKYEESIVKRRRRKLLRAYGRIFELKTGKRVGYSSRVSALEAVHREGLIRYNDGEIEWTHERFVVEEGGDE